MLTCAIALCSLVVAPTQAPTAKQLIEKMLLRYHGAQTLTGTVKLTVSTSAGSASMETAMQYERPSKLYLLQQKTSANPDPDQPARWLVTSDGKMFSYQIPNDRYHTAPGLRLVEPVENPRVKVKHDIASIYAASSKSIGDRSMPLDIAIAAPDDLRYRRAQWATYVVNGEKEIAGKKAYLVGGDFRQYAGAPVSGRYQMAITDTGDILQYGEETNISVGEGAQAQTIKVSSQWDVNLNVNGKVDPALFKVIVR
jgi:hypothetical protein